jgi:Protein of unknown function (DUF3306)
MSDPENFIARWSRRKRAAVERVDDEKTTSETTSGDTTSGETTSEERRPTAMRAALASEASGQRGNSIVRAPDTRPEPGSSAREAAPARSDASPELPFDLAKLPPLESITAESDIRAFLAPGVPAELSRAALRRAWSADPKIRDFVGLADYDWDFNTPGAIAGFGPLEMTDELRRQVAQMVGRSLAPEAPERPAPTSAQAQGEQASVEASDISTESGTTTAADPVQQIPSNVGTSQNKLLRPDVELHNFVQREEDHTAPQYRTEKPDNVQLIAKRPHGRALPK